MSFLTETVVVDWGASKAAEQVTARCTVCGVSGSIAVNETHSSLTQMGEPVQAAESWRIAQLPSHALSQPLQNATLSTKSALDQRRISQTGLELRATQTRALLESLRSRGCTHAMYDRASLVDCIMQPSRDNYASAMAVLLQLDASQMLEILLEKSTQIAWRADAVEVSWARDSLAAVSTQLDCTVRDERVYIEAMSAPEEFWEALVSRGLVSLEWLSDSGRSFRTHVEQDIAPPEMTGNRVAWRRQQTVRSRPKRDIVDHALPHPHTLRDCVTLASDSTGIIAAEALSREVLRRLSPWGEFELRSMTWRVVDPSQWRTVRQPWWSQALRWTMANALKATRIQLPPGHAPTDPDARPSWWTLAARENSLCQLWDQLSAQHVVCEDPVASLTRSFETLLNPFEPVLAIWSTGYVLDEFRDGEAILVAPMA